MKKNRRCYSQYNFVYLSFIIFLLYLIQYMWYVYLTFFSQVWALLPCAPSRLNTSQEVYRHINIALSQVNKLCWETKYITPNTISKQLQVSLNYGQKKLMPAQSRSKHVVILWAILCINGLCLLWFCSKWETISYLNWFLV